MERREPDETVDPEGWVDRHGDVLFRYALLRVRNRETAEELVQEALLAAFRARDRFEGRAKERTWLVQILRHKIVDHYRRRRREIPLTDLADETSPEEGLFADNGHWKQRVGRWTADVDSLVAREDFLLALERCIDGLPPRQGEVFCLRVMDERPPEEAADLLGITKTNLGVLLHRARMKLRECLESGWFRSGGAR